MRGSSELYFNFPVDLLHDFVANTRECLHRIIDVAIYLRAMDLEFSKEDESEDQQMISKMKSASSFFNISLPSVENSYYNAKEVYDNLSSRPPMVGMNVSIFWDFYKNYKSEFDKIVLLAFLSIKSILQRKPYVKMTNNYWLSRMAGLRTAYEIEELPEHITKYSSDYQMRKIKRILAREWHLVTYSRYTRGFYVSFDLDINQLVYEAEKRRKSTKDKQLKKQEHDAVKLALMRLGAS